MPLTPWSYRHRARLHAPAGGVERGRGGAGVPVIQYLLLAVFLVDIGLSFFVGYYDKGRLVVDRAAIVRDYLSFRLWWDLLTTLPWDAIVLAGAGLMGSESAKARYIALLGLLKLGRMYRVGRLFSHLEYSLALPLAVTMLVRLVSYCFFVVHWTGCAFFYIARQEESAAAGAATPALSWAGRAAISGQLGITLDALRAGGWASSVTFEIYVFALYASVVTLSSIGYDGSIHPWTITEVVWSVIYLAFNTFFLAYITGSVTLLVFRVHEAWGKFRDRLRALELYSRHNNLPRDLKAQLQEQLRLMYATHGGEGRELLAALPTTLKRRVLRHEHGKALSSCALLRGVNAKFVDALLCAAQVETYMPRVDMLADGDYANDLTIVVAGYVEVFAPDAAEGEGGAGGGHVDRAAMMDLARYGRTPEQVKRDMAAGKEMSLRGGTAFGGAAAGSVYAVLGPGDVYGAYSFFTEVAQHELVRSLTVARVMVIPRAAYAAIASEFTLSARTVLENLQKMAEAMVQQEFRGGMASRLLRSSLAAAGAYTGLAYQNTSTETSTADSTTESNDGAAGGAGGAGAGGARPAAATVLSLRQRQVVGTLQRVRALVRHQLAGAMEARTGQFLSACGRGESDRVKLMLGQGFSPDATDYANRTGLMVAATNGQKAIVDILLAVNARPNTADRSGSTALLEACRAGQDEVVESLLCRGGRLGLDPVRTAHELNAAITNGDLPYLSRLLRCGADPGVRDSETKSTALHIAAADGNLAACKALVESKAPLDAANRYGHTPLDEAHLAQAAPVVAFLEECVGAGERARARDKYVHYRTELFLRACSSGDAAAVGAMLARDCPPDSADYDARTGLMLAAAKGHRAVLDVLLDAGASPDARDNLGGCALQEAVKAGQGEIAQALRSRGAVLTLSPPDTASLLCNLIFAKGPEARRLLAAYLDAGADVNAADYDRRTPLHIAAAEGDFEAVKLLVGAGALAACQDRWGNTPAAEARRAGAAAVAQFLTTGGR
ncbi:potassium channel [Raphidocelis subcapitata]|uniref:Potassium channel n=1 Tax=Raphidocelis subcapitata TaxID=307507 RepID=A0A2V0PM38_9CHLO|nr:potassium channel [Raphidocelis subcapitata]|eukprot:GBF99143.1 potassium channel [Raphidocelis subcapitata]